MRRFLLAAAAAVPMLLAAGPGEAQRRGPEFFPNLPVVDQDGRALKFYDDLIKDKIVVVMFIYTSCTDICPLTTARMTQIATEAFAIHPGRFQAFFWDIEIQREHRADWEPIAKWKLVESDAKCRAG